jgi:quinohemoprotein ethanol dehydrogenase
MEFRQRMLRCMQYRALFLVLGLGLGSAEALPSTPPHGEGTAQDWPGHNGGTDESAYSRLKQINTANLDRLKLSWYLDLPDERMLEATPLAIHAVLYFTGSYSKTYAVDALTGKLLWSFDPEVWRHNPDKFKVTLPVNRGVGYADGRVFVSTLDGRLIALDAQAGKLLWSVQSVPLESNYTINAAPRVLRGKVLIGESGGDFGERGYLAAYDAKTGRSLWRFYVVPSREDRTGDPAARQALASWDAGTPAGGAPWDSVTVDPDLNRIYLGTGNPSPNDPAKRGASGDNLYTCAIVALDADTGKYVWHYQVNPRDAWDFDAAEQMTLADLRIEGRERKVLMQAPKNGFFYVIDRTTGKLISAGKIGKVNWADHIDVATGRPVDTANNRYEKGAINIWPTAAGAHSWQTMAFAPQAGLVYVPYMQLGVHYGKDAGDALYGGLAISPVKEDDMDGKGSLIAWDPVAQQARWTILHDYLFNGGALATAGGLVFEGAADGYLSAYDAASGARLWHYNAGLGIIAAPISYGVDGRQYISVLVGYGATNIMGVMNAGWKFGAQPRRLLTFALDGKATLPPSAPQDFTVQAVDDPALQLRESDVKAGAGLFTLRCGGCHGLNVVSAGPPGPDLRESRIALNRASFQHVVHDGVLVSRGMPGFAELDSSQLDAIFAYIRAKAREALAADLRPAT